MREAETKTIVIKDVDDDINDDAVSRFIEFLYRGDYAVPDSDILQLSNDTEQVAEAFVARDINERRSEQTLADEYSMINGQKHTGNFWNEPLTKDELESLIPWDHGLVGVRKRKKEKWMQLDGTWKDRLTQEMIDDQLAAAAAAAAVPEPEPEPWPEVEPASASLNTDLFAPKDTTVSRRQLWEGFCSLAYEVPPKQSLPPTKNDQREDFTSIFLCHARLYKLSERYDVSALMSLSLQKLRLTLSQYIFHQERAGAVVELVRYVYRHTMDYDKGRDKLRSLVLDYVVCYISQLEQEQSFVQLLREGGHLASDLLAKMTDLIK